MAQRFSNDVESNLPVARSVAWSPDDAEQTELHAELIQDGAVIGGSNTNSNHPVPSAPSEEKISSKGGGTTYQQDVGYHLATGQGDNRAYWGRFDDPQAEIVGHGAGESGIPVATARPDDRQIRLAFIRKVYTILSAQLLLTFAMCALIALTPTVRSFALGPGIGLFYMNMVVMLVMICFLHAYKRTYPTNYVLLTLFTVSMSYMVGTITAIYEENGAGDLVVEAVFITATVFILLTIFTLQSKWDFSFLGAGLGVCLWIMILWSFFGAIFGFVTGSVYALLGSVLFSVFIIYDTYMIAERLDPEDYIVAAIELYLDIINLFLYILRLLSEMDRR